MATKSESVGTGKFPSGSVVDPGGSLGSGLICSGPLSCGTCGESFLELLTKPKGYENRSYIYALYQQFPIPTFETSISWQWDDSGRKTNIVWRILLKAASRCELGCYSKEPRSWLSNARMRRGAALHTVHHL